MRNDTLIALLGISKIMYEGKIVNLINLDVLARRRAPLRAARASGRARSQPMFPRIVISGPFKFEFCAYLVIKDNICMYTRPMVPNHSRNFNTY